MIKTFQKIKRGRREAMGGMMASFSKSDLEKHSGDIADLINKKKEEHQVDLLEQSLHWGNLKRVKAGQIYYQWDKCGDKYYQFKKIDLVDLKNETLFIAEYSYGTKKEVLRYCLRYCLRWNIDDPRPTEFKQKYYGGYYRYTDIVYPFYLECGRNKIKYNRSDIPKDYLCYNIKELTSCPHLIFNNITPGRGPYRCLFMDRHISLGNHSGLNDKRCKEWRI